MRQLFLYIATGKADMPDSWFAALKAGVTSDAVGVTSSNDQAAEVQVPPTVDLMEPDTDSMAEEVRNTVEDINRITRTLTDKLQQYPVTYLESAKALVRNFGKSE